MSVPQYSVYQTPCFGTSAYDNKIANVAKSQQKNKPQDKTNGPQFV